MANRIATLRGRVRSVHRAAIHVELERTGELLVVAIDDVGGLPGGILVSGSTDLRGIGVEPGMGLRAGGDRLMIPDAPVEIPLDAARPWSPALPEAGRLEFRRDAAACADALADARRIAGRRAPRAGLGPLLADGGTAATGGDSWLPAAQVRIDRQRWAFDADDLASVLGEAVELIGLGPGLTPSGDDYLVGLLAGLDAAGHRSRPALATAVRYAAPDRTTWIGATTLRHAAAGRYAERLHDVLIALADGAAVGLESAVERAMAYGATSGADTLVGLFAALGIAATERARGAGAAA